MKKSGWILFLVLGFLFAQIGFALSGELEISGEVKFPAFIKTDERTPIKINVTGGPVDGDRVTVIFDFDVGEKKGPVQRNKTHEYKRKIVNGSVVVPVWFRDPGQRTAVKCKIRYTLSGSEFETKAVSVNSFQVER